MLVKKLVPGLGLGKHTQNPDYFVPPKVRKGSKGEWDRCKRQRSQFKGMTSSRIIIDSNLNSNRRERMNEKRNALPSRTRSAKNIESITESKKN